MRYFITVKRWCGDENPCIIQFWNDDEYNASGYYARRAELCCALDNAMELIDYTSELNGHAWLKAVCDMASEHMSMAWAYTDIAKNIDL